MMHSAFLITFKVQRARPAAAPCFPYYTFFAFIYANQTKGIGGFAN